MPSLTLFPQAIWARLMDRAFRRAGPKGWTYSAAVGLDELRSAIAAHVAATRGVNCSAGQIVIVSSSHQAVDLAARVLSDVGERAWMEDPGYPTARYVLQAAGLETVAVPVDADGLDLDQAIARAPDARLAYVTPSHQYPTGALMSLERRRALLDWARRSDGWIIEDDYDGDYCFLNRPLAALHALDPTGRVVYIGTFNKVMFPGLRIAYLIAPDRLVDAFAAAKKLADGFTAIHVQSALADFIEGGHLGEHIRRMLVVYDERRQALFDAARKLDDVLDLQPCEAGLHAPAYLRGKADDRRLSAAGAKRGLDLYPISPYYAEAPRMGFVMGFAAPNPDEIRRGIETFAAILRS